MVWWILAAVVLVLVVVAAWRSGNRGHTDGATVVRTRGKDEGRGFGPTSGG